MVIINDDTFEEKASLRMSPLNVFSWVMAILILMVILTTITIAFTPLREYIPGYADVNTRKNATRALLKADSLSRELEVKNRYLQNLKNIISGKPDSMAIDVNEGAKVTVDENALKPSKDDSLLRSKIESEESFNLVFQGGSSKQEMLGNTAFFPPIEGVVSDHFDSKKKHFGIDIVAPKNEAVKATLDGTVIFAEWTTETGHVLQIQHINNLISVYKHNSVLMKQVGDRVEAGEVVAIIGESGDLKTGPHLHFELWHEGQALDPEEYMIFKDL